MRFAYTKIYDGFHKIKDFGNPSINAVAKTFHVLNSMLKGAGFYGVNTNGH